MKSFKNKDLSDFLVEISRKSLKLTIVFGGFLNGYSSKHPETPERGIV